jgi:hypothetical protein
LNLFFITKARKYERPKTERTLESLSFVLSPFRVFVIHRMNKLSILAVSAWFGLCCVAASNAADDGWIVLSDGPKAFQPPTGEWFVAGDAKIDPADKKRLIGQPGRGVIINGRSGVTDNLLSRGQWGDVELSLEFLIPQGSNSGVKLQGLYEVQIFDSWQVPHPTGSDCGGIYPRAELMPGYRHIDEGIAPRVNAARAPGQWQTLEIVFRAPKFDSEGRKTANARFDRVVLNGQLVHENVELDYPTGHYWRDKERAVGPLMLQADHGPVAFRNLRLRPLGAH